MPLVAVAVCPHPPLLIPSVAAGAAAELDPLRAACATAVSRLRGASLDRLVVVGSAERTTQHQPPYGGTMAPWGVDITIGTPGGDRLPLSLLIGTWLIGLETPTAELHTDFHAIARDAPPDDCVALGQRFAGAGDRVGMLVMGDGSACRGPGAPGYDDPAAEPFDEAAAAALGKADAQALLAIDPALAARLRVTGRAPWQVLAGAALATQAGAANAGAANAGAANAGAANAEMLYHEAPYGVAYLVASWR